jgi:hypothetical protein
MVHLLEMRGDEFGNGGVTVDGGTCFCMSGVL